MQIRYLLILIFLLLSACAVTPPFEPVSLQGINTAITPEQAIKENVRDVRVLWGGVIISSENMPDHTEFKVLFYPLDKAQRPDLNNQPQGRFILRYAGYLETMVYAPGREISVVGSLAAAEEGKIGDAPYHFAVLRADKLHLWPVRADSRVRFGIGVGIGLHM